MGSCLSSAPDPVKVIPKKSTLLIKKFTKNEKDLQEEKTKMAQPSPKKRKGPSIKVFKSQTVLSTHVKTFSKLKKIKSKIGKDSKEIDESISGSD